MQAQLDRATVTLHERERVTGGSAWPTQPKAPQLYIAITLPLAVSCKAKAWAGLGWNISSRTGDLTQAPM